MVAVGGAKAQSRFNGKTAIPLGSCVPLSSAALAPPASVPQQQRPQQPASTTLSLPAAPAARHGAWGRQAVGHTIDGSVPASASGGALMGEHVSRWRYDWHHHSWVLKGAQAADATQLLPGGSTEKHQLAARRWGEGRDALGAAASRQQPAGGAGLAPAVAAAAAAAARLAGCCPGQASPPACRPAERGTHLTPALRRWGGLQRQKEALMAAVAYPLAHPRLFSALGASAARGVLLHGPPGAPAGRA